MRIPGFPDFPRPRDPRGLARLAYPSPSALAADRAAALVYAAFTLFGLAVVALSDQPVHRLWGGSAAVGYACAALTCLALARLAAWRGRGLAVTAAVAVAVAGALLVPLCWLAVTGRGMPEVWVVAHSAESLVKHGTPYQSAARLGANVYGYDPYLPGMTLFGLPCALFGGGLGTDPRLWDGLAFAAAFAAALRVAGGTGTGGTGTGGTGTGRPGSAVRSTAMLASSPLVAFPLAVSGNDLPVIGLLCLGLALAGRSGPGRPPRPAGPPRTRWSLAAPGSAVLAAPPVQAGAVLGAAAALKATAWPALLIVAVLFAARDGRVAAVRFAATAAAVLAVVVGPFLIIQPVDLAANTIAFPLGLARAHSPATSPLPGHLIAATGPAGHLAVIALLVAAALALGVALAVRPPRTSVAAAGYLALALTALFTLAPATRWGYFSYPAVIGCWLWLTVLAAARATGQPRQRLTGCARTVTTTRSR